MMRHKFYSACLNTSPELLFLPKGLMEVEITSCGALRQKDDASLFVIKDYGADGSDRLDREWAFLTSLARYKIADAPAPIWVDRHRGLACFSHLDGRKLALEDITENHILQASDIYKRVCKGYTH